MDKAFVWMEKGYQLRDSDFIFNVRSHPMFEKLRGDARYKALMRRMNLRE